MKQWLTRGVCLTLLAGASFPRDTIRAVPQERPASGLQIAPNSLTFPAQKVDTAGPAQTVTLRNSGSNELQISDILPSGIDFAETNTCGASLAPGASCLITVTFKPATIGPRLGTMSIMSSGPGSPHRVALTGAGE